MSPPDHARADGQAGFTLMEILVSLVVMALILSFIPATLRIGQRVWETDDAFERRQGLASFRRYVEQRLAETLPLHGRDAAQALRIEFSGEPGRVAFIAPAAAGPAGGGIYRFELTMEEGIPGAALILRQALYRPGGNGAPDGALVRAVAMEHRSHHGNVSLALRYFGSAADGEPASWHTRWPRDGMLPALVELSLTVAGERPRLERSIVPLRLRGGP